MQWGQSMMRKLTAEFIGTAWFVLGGCGAAVLAAAFPALGIGFVHAALAGFVYRWLSPDEPAPVIVSGR
jgi:glycerol uptake facilitator-like aquaporin